VCGEGVGGLGCIGAIMRTAGSPKIKAGIGLWDGGAGGTSDFSALSGKGTAAASGMVGVVLVAGWGGDRRRKGWMSEIMHAGRWRSATVLQYFRYGEELAQVVGGGRILMAVRDL
jgi:hypothetical protein